MGIIPQFWWKNQNSQNQDSFLNSPSETTFISKFSSKSEEVQNLAKKVLFFTKKALKRSVFQLKFCQDIRTAPGNNYYFIVCFDLRKIREKMQKNLQNWPNLTIFQFFGSSGVFFSSCDTKIGCELLVKGPHIWIFGTHSNPCR